MIERLQVSHLRNITRADLRLGPCNVLVGANGSGKTSLLEALFLLSRGKSFRHHQPKRYIQHHQPAVTVHATFYDGVTVAIQKQLDASTALRLNQNTIYTQSALTQQLPTLLIDPSSMDMLEQGSASRRQLLDWLAFHMKPGFHAQWLAYQRLLKQRNRLLKQSRQLSANQRQELSAWDTGLANHAALIHHYRQQVFEAWQPHFARCVNALLPKYSGQLSLSYAPGFDTQLGLKQQLDERLNQDMQQGFTRMGSHRADIQVHWRSHRATAALGSQANEDNLSNNEDVAEAGGQSRNQQTLGPALDQDSKMNSSDILTSDIHTSDIHTSDIHTSKMNKSEISREDFGENADFEEAGIEEQGALLKEQAANVLSRGEKKLLITALKLSQLPLLLTPTAFDCSASIRSVASVDSPALVDNITSSSSKMASEVALQAHVPAVLLDDITAELDDRAIKVLLSTLSSLSCQVFITSLTDDIVPTLQNYWSNFNMFHVKHGEIDALTL